MVADLADACGEEPGAVCEWVFEQTDNETLATVADWLLDRPLKIVVILVVALVANWLIRAAIDRFVHSLVEAPEERYVQVLRERGVSVPLIADERARERAAARSHTIGQVLRSLTSLIIVVMAGFLILGELGINLGPLVAGAGVAGVALGFGAQTIVRDFLSGLFMLIEDQYGVGDIIDVGEASGTVERVSLRTTVVRDVQGTLWFVPNGEIRRVGNYSQIWARALIDVSVAYDADVRRAMALVKEVADGLWHDDSWEGGRILEEPEVLGVQGLDADGVTIRLSVKTQPSTQWPVERELRLRLKEAFDAAGIEIPFPQRTVWVRPEATTPKVEPEDSSPA